MTAKIETLQKLQTLSRQMYELQQSYFSTYGLARMAGWLTVDESGATLFDLTSAEVAALGKDAVTASDGVTAQMGALTSIGAQDAAKIVQFAY